MPRHLLGNYPAALNRAGYESYMRANAAAATDTVEYRRQLDQALVAFEASLVVEPFNDQALEFYPLLLVQAYEDEKAMAFLQLAVGATSRSRLEERTVYNSLRGFVRGGVPDLAFAWLAQAIDESRTAFLLPGSVRPLPGAWGGRMRPARPWRPGSGSAAKRTRKWCAAWTRCRAERCEREQERIDDAVGRAAEVNNLQPEVQRK